ncbi:MAG TPA: elongation factor G [Verrucomicrobiae bacterium]|jgi:elongation factor G
MKVYQPADIRNFAIVGHASSGKTLLAEAMLMCSGVIHRMGSIAQGSTVSDYHPGELQRLISIHATPMHCEWQEKKLNFIDTPGYLDFISESLNGLRVVDFALIVIHANHGISVGTEQVWDYATQFGIPKIIVINALDKEHTNFDRLLAEVRERFGNQIFPMQIPINPGPGFNQILDVLRNEVVTYPADRSGKYQEVPATGEWEARVKELHKELIEHIAESDDKLLEKYFDEGGLSEEVMRTGIHPALQKRVFIPLFCTSGETNVGVARLLDFISKFGSSPVDRHAVDALDGRGAAAQVELTSPEPVAYSFKTLTEAQGGDLSYLRVYSGTVRTGMDLYNPDRKTTERIGQLFVINGKIREAADALRAGDIGAAARLKDTHTGNTLCDPKHLVTLPKVAYPKPHIHAALNLKAKGEEDKVAAGLAALHEEDPTFLYHFDSELHQTVISAQGQLHLEVLLDRLKRRYRVDVELLAPKVRFRETIRAKGDSKYRHKKQTGGAGQFAEVWMRIEPLPRDSGVDFNECLTGQNVDRTFVPSVEKGVNTACSEGILAGYRVTDVKIEFYDGKMHPVDSKDIAFQIAGYFAFKEAFAAARPCILEPIHTIEVRIPEDCMGKVMGDLSSRRGRILGMDSNGTKQIIRAEVPAMELHQYATILRSLTGGRGMHDEDFSRYEQMPAELEAKVVAESKKAKELANGHK